jgi:hypothetical protein
MPTGLCKMKTYPYGVRSNEADVFYAATPGSLSGLPRNDYFQTVMPSTMVHELKHLIMYSERLPKSLSSEDSWWEEGAAVAAAELAGYGSHVGRTQDYAQLALAAPQSFRLIYQSRDELSAEEQITMYGYNFLMLWRIAEKVGHDNFWKRWTAGPQVGIANLEAHTGQSLPEMMLDFATTLLLDGTNEGFDYQSLSLRDGTWQPLGYSALSSTQGSARSMAYYLGRGMGGNASITIQSQHSQPYAVVVRLPESTLPQSSAALKSFEPLPPSLEWSWRKVGAFLRQWR